FSDGVRRQEVHHATQWSQQRAPLQRMLVDLEPAAFLPGVGCLACLVLHHLDCHGHAGLPDFCNMGMVDEMGCGSSHSGSQCLVGFDDAVLLEDVQRSQCS